jgi:hypothetical protein
VVSKKGTSHAAHARAGRAPLIQKTAAHGKPPGRNSRADASRPSGFRSALWVVTRG